MNVIWCKIWMRDGQENKKMHLPGFEPGTSRVWGERDNQLHHKCNGVDLTSLFLKYPYTISISLIIWKFWFSNTFKHLLNTIKRKISKARWIRWQRPEFEKDSIKCLGQNWDFPNEAECPKVQKFLSNKVKNGKVDR